jgi:hypothetical protein
MMYGKYIIFSIGLLMSAGALAQDSTQFSMAETTDHRAIVMNIPLAQQCLQQISVPVNSIDNFISTLGTLRSTMIPPIPQQNPEKGQAIRLSNPGRWYVERNPAGGIVVAILDPGFGWVGLAMSSDDVARFEQSVHQSLPPAQ